ncbi:isochorismatase hydrolase [Mycolicibacterium canariasense]|uniref:Isochorismatase hydrolase n=1 Tax=Mycolicibacterium canariasense TaxID=228230 RepID=A0A100WD41_MYCCR|nr:isochorismatase family cysteine hydrolase [Mycolicibacterium canariasense]MCV7207941.1 cysteine hydrolase [Mycolicibacterium canariasense]ORV04977.1 isochorismatase [Mycolicibacterium canariasense]GAS95991.1 isochorismatase hydrolase [Mycolicibacterium canariasense]
MSDCALLVVDMFNDYRHEDADALADNVGPIVAPLAALAERARDHDGVDLVYVNDNRGDFTASTDDIVRGAVHGRRPDLVKPLVPAPDALFVTKVRHSVFYATPLDYLLQRLGTKMVILTGQVTEQCIMYSALDAYVRHFDIVIPADAVAHIDADLGRAALAMMQRNMRAAVTDCANCLPD